MSLQEIRQRRLPTKSDFPTECEVGIVPSPDNKSPKSVLILLHGFGDTEQPFTALGNQLKLPNTACISIRGPTVLPFHDNGFHWGDDLIFDSSTSALDPDGGFKKATAFLRDTVSAKVLLQTCGFAPRDVYFLGLGQGGMAALNVSLTEDRMGYGGVISIGGPLPAEAPASSKPLRSTPILVCAGSNSRWVTDAAVARLKNNFSDVQTSYYQRQGDGMPQNREEMLPIMQFLARRLRSAAPSGAIELS